MSIMFLFIYLEQYHVSGGHKWTKSAFPDWENRLHKEKLHSVSTVLAHSLVQYVLFRRAWQHCLFKTKQLFVMHHDRFCLLGELIRKVRLSRMVLASRPAWRSATYKMGQIQLMLTEQCGRSNLFMLSGTATTHRYIHQTRIQTLNWHSRQEIICNFQEFHNSIT